MANKKQVKKENKPLIKTKHKLDNSIEIQVTKSPAKTLSGKIFAWLVIAGTVLVPVAGLLYLLFQ